MVVGLPPEVIVVLENNLGYLHANDKSTVLEIAVASVCDTFLESIKKAAVLIKQLNLIGLEFEVGLILGLLWETLSGHGGSSGALKVVDAMVPFEKTKIMRFQHEE